MPIDSKFGSDDDIVQQVIQGTTPTAVGNAGEIQWNFNDIMAADTKLHWDAAASKLTVTGDVTTTGTTEIFAVTMRGHIIPDVDNTVDIGSASNKIRDMYVSESTIYMGDEATIKSEGTAIVVQDLKTSDLHLDNTQREGNNVDGTNGSWTFQEGADNLFLLNNITGKKYKINLTEI